LVASNKNITLAVSIEIQQQLAHPVSDAFSRELGGNFIANNTDLNSVIFMRSKVRVIHELLLPLAYNQIIITRLLQETIDRANSMAIGIFF
jgi:hypothetical protein